MNSQRTTSLFPDTNLFLHYRPLNEIDWCALLQADTVEIKIAPVVTRELEEKKTLHPSRKIRDRASTALKLLQRYLSEAAPRLVRDGVTLDFLVKEPVPEFAASRGLNLQLGDDRLIGTLLLYHEEHADVRCVLATNDFPLTVKATHYEIDFVTPSESLSLPDQPDETEKKLKQVQAELLQYKSREPVLAVRFEGGEDHARFRITRPSGDSEAEIRGKVEEAKQKHPSIHAKSQQSAGASGDVNSAISEMTEAIIQAAAGFDAIHERLYAGYNMSIEKYYLDYEKYLRDSFAFDALALRSIKLDLFLENNGTAPAEDVHVLLHFPDGFALYDDEDLPEAPKEPSAPSAQMNLMPNFSLAYPDVRSLSSLSQPPNPHLPRIRRTNSYEVTFEYERVRHGFTWQFHPLYVAFDLWESANSFSICYKIYAGNMLAQQDGTLGVIIERA